MREKRKQMRKKHRESKKPAMATKQEKALQQLAEQFKECQKVLKAKNSELKRRDSAPNVLLNLEISQKFMSNFKGKGLDAVAQETPQDLKRLH